jgi:hypothetical protein
MPPGRMATAIPFAFDDYLELVDATGRVFREDKPGFIPGQMQRTRAKEWGQVSHSNI